MKHAAVCAPRRPHHEKNRNLAGEINVRDIDGHDFPFTGKKWGMTTPAVKTILRRSVFRAAFSASDNSIICIHYVGPFLEDRLF
jgi:hypothetical protein